MDFALNEEQKMIRNSARDFLKSECPKSVVRELEESDFGYLPELWNKMAGLGWLGLPVPEEYEGTGLGLLELAVLFEEFGRAAMPGPVFTTVISTLAILEGGTEEQKRKILPDVVSGKLILTLAMDEPGSICDPEYVTTRAVKHDDGYSITGAKMFVPYANVAHRLVVVARTEGESGDKNGITLFLVDAQAPGIQLTAIKTIATDKQFQVDLSNVQVSAENIIGKLNDGYPLIKTTIEKAMAIQCAEMVGGAQQELDLTAEYTKTRIQFDRPIGTFQAAQHRLSDMYIDVQAARFSTYNAVWRLSEGLPSAKELAIAKLVTGKSCQRVAFSAQQLHGGIGVDLDYDLHFYYRREKALELTLGTPAYHLESLADVLNL